MLEVLDTTTETDETPANLTLDTLAREGARRTLIAALQIEVAEYVDAYQEAREARLIFFAFPAEQWIHLRITNVIESPFATVGLRQRVTTGAGSRTKGLLMAYKLLDMPQRRGRRPNAAHLLPLVRDWCGLSRRSAEGTKHRGGSEGSRLITRIADPQLLTISLRLGLAGRPHDDRQHRADRRHVRPTRTYAPWWKGSNWPARRPMAAESNPRRPRAVRLLSIDRPVMECLRGHRICCLCSNGASAARGSWSLYGCCARRSPCSRRAAGREPFGTRRRRVAVQRQHHP